MGVGSPTPTLWVVDDPAPNALVAGRARDGFVCVTTGALELPSAELDALIAHSVLRLADPHVALASAGAAILIACDRIVRWTWFLLAFAFYLTVVGVPVQVVGAMLAFVGALILVCVPLLGLGTRFAVSLLDHAGALADLETARVTYRPKALADLLLRVLDDDKRVQTPWQVAHLWFERDGLWRESSFGPEPARIAYRLARTSRKPLLERASIAVDLAHGDRRLRKRLERAEQATR